MECAQLNFFLGRQRDKKNFVHFLSKINTWYGSKNKEETNTVLQSNKQNTTEYSLLLTC